VPVCCVLLVLGNEGEPEPSPWVYPRRAGSDVVLTGLTKLTPPREKLAAGPMSWAADVSDAQFRRIGVLELLGAAGLILPGVLGIAGVTRRWPPRGWR
jgi:hypothetical protein